MFNQQWLSHLELHLHKLSMNEALFDIRSMSLDEAWSLYLNLRNKGGD
jgi:hypothetical protein